MGAALAGFERRTHDQEPEEKLGMNSSFQPSDSGVLGHCTNSFRKEWNHTGDERVDADVV